MFQSENFTAKTKSLLTSPIRGRAPSSPPCFKEGKEGWFSKIYFVIQTNPLLMRRLVTSER